MKFFVIGIDDGQRPEFPSKVRQIVAGGRLFSGGARHHEIVREMLPEGYRWVNITVPLENVFAQYDGADEIVVFASGDPLFFGFANTIMRMRPAADVEVFPHFNSLQLLAHRLLLPYHDMRVVSLTGRPWQKFDEALILGTELMGVLTDNKAHTPGEIARRMLAYGYGNYQMHVGELLGNETAERVSSLTIQEVAGRDFLFPNNLILEKTETRRRPLGIPESDFHWLNGRAKMITKMPIRLISLSLLDLRDRQVFWDVGFCTGSVSVEAKLQFPHLQVFAFEQRTEGAELMENNSKKFGTPGIEFFIGDFLETDVSSLPRPDAVFIGGHGGKLLEMMRKIVAVLNENGVIVFNSVSEESRRLFLEAVGECGLLVEQGMKIQLDDFNAIEVMKACR